VETSLLFKRRADDRIRREEGDIFKELESIRQKIEKMEQLRLIQAENRLRTFLTK
jgi:hypothetical protein